MKLKPHDLVLTFDDDANRLEVKNPAGIGALRIEARNKTVRNGQLGHFGNCPPGEFILGNPVVENTTPFGPFFIPILDYNGHHAMRDHHRAGIGIHGGGSGLPDPQADHQGWVVTEGCIRVQNADLKALVKMVQMAQAQGGTCYLTVTRTPQTISDTP